MGKQIQEAPNWSVNGVSLSNKELKGYLQPTFLGRIADNSVLLPLLGRALDKKASRRAATDAIVYEKKTGINPDLTAFDTVAFTLGEALINVIVDVGIALTAPETLGASFIAGLVVDSVVDRIIAGQIANLKFPKKTIDGQKVSIEGYDHIVNTVGLIPELPVVAGAISFHQWYGKSQLRREVREMSKNGAKILNSPPKN